MNAFVMNASSLEREAAETAQAGEEREQGQAQYGGVVAFHLLEQMNAEAFDLIHADALEHIRTGKVEVERDAILRQRAKGQARPRHEGFHPLSADGDRRRGVQGVASSRERLQMFARGLRVGGLVKHGARAIEN